MECTRTMRGGYGYDMGARPLILPVAPHGDSTWLLVGDATRCSLLAARSSPPKARRSARPLAGPIITPNDSPHSHLHCSVAQLDAPPLVLTAPRPIRSPAHLLLRSPASLLPRSPAHPSNAPTPPLVDVISPAQNPRPPPPPARLVLRPRPRISGRRGWRGGFP